MSRQALYEQVWTTPMRKLAAAYGLSDVGLAKICDRHDIPRPPRGYWIQKEFGRNPEPSPLLLATHPELQTVHLSAIDPRSTPKAACAGL